MSKSPKYAISINKRRRFTGRLIGLIDENECRAIMNVEDAARKISTAEGIKVSELDGKIPTGKRFVVVTDDITRKGKREVFISPEISHVTIQGQEKGYSCRDKNVYHFEAI